MSENLLIIASTASHLQHFHLPYIRAFRQMGYSVHAAFGGENTTVEDADFSHFLPFEKSLISFQNIRATVKIRKLLRDVPFAAVLCHTTLAAFFTRLACFRLPNRPIIINTVHGYLFDDCSPLPKRLLYQAAERLTAPVTDCVITMNQEDYELAKQHHYAGRVEFCRGMGVDFSRFSTEKNTKFRESLNLSANDFVLIYAAEFSKRKNQKMLIEAMVQLPQNVQLILPGDGALLAQCKQLAARLGVENRIIFPGRVTPIADWYAAADCVVSASRSEGLPFHLAEAMYCELPAIVTDVKGHRELVQNEQNGYLFAYNDIPAFQNAVCSLAANGEKRSSMSCAAHNSVLQYGQDVVLRDNLRLYDALIHPARKEK